LLPSNNLKIVLLKDLHRTELRGKKLSIAETRERMRRAAVMNVNLVVPATSVLAVALFVSAVVGAQPDHAAVSGVGGSLPAPEASMSAPVTQEPAPTPVAENPLPTPPAEASAPQPEAPPIFKADQLDQLLAPVALYPDALLAQILMAAAYPLEVVKADRWLQDPSHANLREDQLAEAIEAETWDPSVKSLVPFPHILRMMDQQLDWTEQLGNAVVAQQPDVMDAIQRLRHEAAAAGTLWSNAQQRVTTERQGIVIEPANPEFVYPPTYNPAGVYGPWPYPDYPPFDITPLDTDLGLAGPFGLGFGVGFVVMRPLWGWCSFDWAQRRIRLDVAKFNAFNRHMPGTATSTWHRDPSRLSLPLRDFASRAPIQVLRGSAISAARIPRGVPSTAASVPAARRSWVPPEFTPVGRAPTAVLRSATRSFAFAGRGLQARSEWHPSLGSRWIMPSTMPRHLAQPIIPRTVARSTALAPGGGHFGGAFRR
jgi:hypothetical protein